MSHAAQNMMLKKQGIFNYLGFSAIHKCFIRNHLERKFDHSKTGIIPNPLKKKGGECLTVRKTPKAFYPHFPLVVYI